MESRQTILQSSCKIAICGKHFSNDTIHVGLYWNYENKKSVFHFLNGEKIPIQNADSNYFDDYLFNPIYNFPEFLLPTLIAISELISENKLNGFVFNREGFIYDGGKFNFNSGNYDVKPIEKMMNCGVFIIALLNTFDFKLINWNTWPNQIETDYLNDWLFLNQIPKKDWIYYYSQSKTIRGKHILISPSTITKPSNFEEADFMSNVLIAKLTN